MSSLPPCDLNYLLELGKMHKMYPSLEIFQVDALLRANSQMASAHTAPPSPAPSTSTTEEQLKRMIPAKPISTPPLKSEAKPWTPEVLVAPTMQMERAERIEHDNGLSKAPAGPRRGRSLAEAMTNKSWANIAEGRE
jgi:hypothetical protein